jgi:RHS repeat-associated protein
VNPFKYVGRLGYYYDTDLTQSYLRARSYDPNNGRFLSTDPLGVGSQNNANLILYTQNNPANITDPAGRGVLATPPWFPVIKPEIVPGGLTVGSVPRGLPGVERGVTVWQCPRPGFAIDKVINPSVKGAKGWFVQHITIRARTYNCDGTEINRLDEEWYEARPINLDWPPVAPGMPPMPRVFPGGFTDTWAYFPSVLPIGAPFANCTRGYVRFRGYALFVRLWEPSIPPWRKRPGGGDLLTHNARPWWWKEGWLGLERRARMSWDCCIPTPTYFYMSWVPAGDFPGGR